MLYLIFPILQVHREYVLSGRIDYHPLYFTSANCISLGEKRLGGVTILDDSECKKACSELRKDYTIEPTEMKQNDFCAIESGPSGKCFRNNIKLSTSSGAELICKKEGNIYPRCCHFYATS